VKKDVAYVKDKIEIFKEDLEDVESDVKELKKGNKNTQTAVNSFVKFSQVSNCKGVERDLKNNLKRVKRDSENRVTVQEFADVAAVEHLGRPIQQIGQKRNADYDEGEGNKRRRIKEGNNIHLSQHQEARCFHHR
jgi:hypothetical protein